MGRQAGDIVSNQHVRPVSTVIADIISGTNPDNPEAENTQLSEALATGSAEIALLVDAATLLYNALLDARIDADFQSALNDLFVHGSLQLPALAPIAAQLEADLAKAEQQRGVRIKTAATRLLHLNVAPTARNDTRSTPKNTLITISVLDNDIDDNGSSLSVTSVTQGAHGGTVINANATVTYTPSADFEEPTLSPTPSVILLASQLPPRSP